MKQEENAIIIDNPGPKMRDLIKRMRAYKQRKREEIKTLEPLFTLQ